MNRSSKKKLEKAKRRKARLAKGRRAAPSSLKSRVAKARGEYTRSITLGELSEMYDKGLIAPPEYKTMDKRVPAFWDKSGSTKEHEEYFAKSLEAYGITIPSTIQEFRDNLRKYFGGVPTDDGDWLLDVRSDSTTGNKMVPISKLEKLGDLYELTGTGFGGAGGSPMIVPLCEPLKDTQEFREETGQIMGVWGYFADPDNFTLHENYDGWNPAWVELDSKLWRECLGLLLGEFSGYGFEDTRSDRVAPDQLNKMLRSILEGKEASV